MPVIVTSLPELVEEVVTVAAAVLQLAVQVKVNEPGIVISEGTAIINIPDVGIGFEGVKVNP